MTLPKMAVSIENIVAKQDAVDLVDDLIKENKYLQDVFAAIQPLLFAMTEKLYKDNSGEEINVQLGQLVEDSVKWINEKE